ncbi:hypothetical protein F3Y22_tig00111023pilonHSYRG00025 [Hibiscus syriacus]|uniref:Uncharacterized protein n=1 Tax=Hibiscus syriacus TaxID=106335 RepID=A0A6A2Z677_HIBSY|nr:hypothetical protein F3Y22_tig00111023pilonHSYRG00025 [Hibiscus syriacus]
MNLDGNGGDVSVILGNNDVVTQNDDVALDFLGDTLGAGLRDVQPYGVTERSITQTPKQYNEHRRPPYVSIPRHLYRFRRREDLRKWDLRKNNLDLCLGAKKARQRG